MTMWLWSVDTEDWKGGGSGSSYWVNRIISLAESEGGALRNPVVLMHNQPVGNRATISALPVIINFFRSRGSHFVKLSVRQGLLPERARQSVPIPPEVPLEPALLPRGGHQQYPRGTGHPIGNSAGPGRWPPADRCHCYEGGSEQARGDRGDRDGLDRRARNASSKSNSGLGDPSRGARATRRCAASDITELSASPQPSRSQPIAIPAIQLSLQRQGRGWTRNPRDRPAYQPGHRRGHEPGAA